MNKSTLITVIITLSLGMAAGYFAHPYMPTNTPQVANDTGKGKVLFYRNPMNPAITSPVPAKDNMGMDYIPVYAENDQSKEKKVLFYRNPMNPAITSPVPAQDEMGMDYLPVYADDGCDSKAPAGTVSVDGTLAQSIGVRTALAERRSLSRAINTIGRVTFDEERVARLHPKYDGWVEKLMVDKTGEKVTKGKMLMGVYSPQLVATQEEYILALNNADILKDSPFPDIRNGAQQLVESAKRRLQLLDVPAHQLRALKRKREVMKSLHIHSPFNGIIMAIGAREGERITPATELYMIADLTHVWVIVDLYEDDLPWVREGDEVAMRVTGIPGRVFNGTVNYIYPYLEAKTRTIKLRLEFDNHDLVLKPEMFANVTIAASKQVNAIVIPAEAIVRSGQHEQVFVQREADKFEPRQVTLGVAADGMVQIINGLKEGERVVTSSQFMIDSESKLKEATAKMLEASKPPASQPPVAAPQDMQMDGMNMDDMDMSNMEMGNKK